MSDRSAAPMAAIILTLRNDLLWADLAGAPVVARTLEAVMRSPLIAAVAVVADAARQAEAERIAQACGAEVVVRIVMGDGVGERDGMAEWLAALPEHVTALCVHDGARPFVTADLIAAGCAAAQRTGAAMASVPLKETIKRVDQLDMVVETPDRAYLYTLQTPLCVERDLLEHALRARATAVVDVAHVAESCGVPVAPFPGAYTNLRIASAQDLAQARAMWTAREHERVS